MISSHHLLGDIVLGVLALLALFAACLQAAVQRNPDIQEPVIVQALRRLKVGAWICLSLPIWWHLGIQGDVPVPMPIAIGMIVIAFVDIVFASIRLFNIIQLRTWEDILKQPDVSTQSFTRSPQVARLLKTKQE